MEKVRKNVARRLWNDGKGIVIVPCNLNPFSAWVNSYPITKAEFEELGYETEFDKIVNSFEYYNCTNSETGRRAAYYVEQ